MSLGLGRSLNRGLRWNLNWSWSCCEVFEALYPPRVRLRGSIRPHNRSRTNTEHGAKQRSPRRPQEENEGKHKHQKRFPKSRLRVAFIIDIEQQCEERSHFNTLASSTPKLTPNTSRPLAAITPIATQRRTADQPAGLGRSGRLLSESAKWAWRVCGAKCRFLRQLTPDFLKLFRIFLPWQEIDICQLPGLPPLV